MFLFQSRIVLGTLYSFVQVFIFLPCFDIIEILCEVHHALIFEFLFDSNASLDSFLKLGTIVLSILLSFCLRPEFLFEGFSFFFLDFLFNFLYSLEFFDFILLHIRRNSLKLLETPVVFLDFSLVKLFVSLVHLWRPSHAICICFRRFCTMLILTAAVQVLHYETHLISTSLLVVSKSKFSNIVRDNLTWT